ncbi:MAG: L,D-transpeptidase family protein [Bdellovibrionia bacterium]
MKIESICKSFLFIALAPLLGAWVNPAACEKHGTSIVVETGRHRLYVCENGKTQISYRSALGRGGLDKRVEGDNKTPFGTYPLGKPRTSNEFHVFIPVGYPTRNQKLNGYTGGDIGIHGPPVRFAESYYVSAAISYLDWTRGCIALGQNDFIEAVAAWVETHPKALLHLLP